SADVDDGLATYAAVTAAWNADQIRILRAATAAARRGKAAIEELLAAELNLAPGVPWRAVVNSYDSAGNLRPGRGLSNAQDGWSSRMLGCVGGGAGGEGMCRNEQSGH